MNAQRFGRIIEAPPDAASPHAVPFFVRDDETGQVFDFSYLEVVTEGFRGSRIGERVRFLTDPDRPGGAVYVVRLDLPDVDEYYR